MVCLSGLISAYVVELVLGCSNMLSLVLQGCISLVHDLILFEILAPLLVTPQGIINFTYLDS